jgi:hypothetical protein
MLRVERLSWILPLISLFTAACSGAGDESDPTENTASLQEPFRNGTVVTPFGPDPAPLHTKAVVDLNGCTGTLIDPYWAISAAHCEFPAVWGATSRRPSGDVSATSDAVFTKPNSDMALLHLTSPIDTTAVPLRGGTTAGIVGNPVDCYGYGAKATSNACSTDADCPSGQWCAAETVCVTPSAELRTGTLSTQATGDPLFFFSPTNSMGQMILPGDSGGPCFLGGQLAGVISSWALDLSGSGIASVPAAADWHGPILNEAGFARVNHTFGSANTPSSASLNTNGGTNSASWTQTGVARVDFPGLGKVGGGTVQVTAIGTTSARCKVGGWGATGTKVEAWVNCYTAGGARVSVPFAVSYVRRAGTPGMEGAYVWANSASAASYTPARFYQWNSTGAVNTVTRTGLGRYTVSFPGQTFTGGTVEVSAYGGGTGYCKVEAWFSGATGQDVLVRCFTTSGAPADELFTAKFTRGSPTLARTFGFAWANEPSNPSYQPSSTYQLTSVSAECGQQTRGPVTITRSSTGRYRVSFAGLPANSPLKSHVKVTGYGSGSDTCKLVGWTGGVNNSSADVACFSAGGNPVDAFYAISFSSTGWIIC